MSRPAVSRCVPRALGLLACALFVQACPDPEARYDAFLDRTADMRGAQPPDDDGGEPMTGERFDFTGSYVLGLSVTLSPDKPILLALEADVSEDLEHFDLSLEPLATEADTDPLTPLGDPIMLSDVAYNLDGSFETPALDVTIPGRANPISGSQIVAEVALAGSVLPADEEEPQRLCGQATGEVREPLMLDLAGSTFGAVLADELDSTGVLASCPASR